MHKHAMIPLKLKKKKKQDNVLHVILNHNEFGFFSKKEIS